MNGYSVAEIRKTFTCFDNKRFKACIEKEEEPIRDVVVVPYYQTITNMLTTILRHRNISRTSYPLSKLKQQLWRLKILWV